MNPSQPDTIKQLVRSIEVDQEEAIENFPTDFDKHSEYATVVFFIFERNKETVIRYLLKEHPACLTLLNSKGESPLFIAISKNCSVTKKVLKMSDCTIHTNSNQSALHYLAASTLPNKIGLMKIILDQYPIMIEDTDINGLTPLHVAAMAGDMEACEFLVKVGANRKSLTKSYMTPAQCALASGNMAVWELLSEGESVEPPMEMDQEAERSFKATLEEVKKRGKEKITEIKTSLNDFLSKRKQLEERVACIINEKAKSDLLLAHPYDPKRPYRILSIDGGGMKGILEALILKRIVDKHPNFLKNIDLICGCSVGSILASFLAVGYEPDTCMELLELISEKLFVNPSLSLSKAKYNTKALKIILESCMKDKRIKDIKRHFLVDSFLIDTDATPRECQAHCFTNLQDGYEDERLVDICLRSSAAPVYFLPYQNYVDGGILNNTPVGVSWGYLFGEKGLQLDPKQVVCFSLSAGRPDPYYIDIKKVGNGGMVQWATQVSDLFMYATVCYWHLFHGDLQRRGAGQRRRGRCSLESVG